MKSKKEEIAEVEEKQTSELAEPIWSVVTFETIAASGLTYEQAAEKLEKLKTEKVSGLCVITDEAAARMAKTTDKK